MNGNRKASDRIQATGTLIRHLFWLAAEDLFYCKDLEEVLFDHTPQDIANAVGVESIAAIEVEDLGGEGFLDVMDTNNKLGFLAELAIPKCTDFDDEGCCSRIPGSRYLDLVYAETREELADKIVAASKKMEEYDRAREAKEATG